MSTAQWRAFITEGTRTGMLATIRRDGGPHVAPVWFVLDGDDLVFTTSGRSVKGRALRRQRRAALCVDDRTPPYAFVTITGAVSISGDRTELLRWATIIAGRYMGQHRAEEYGQRNTVPTEVLVRLHIEHVVARSGVAEQGRVARGEAAG